MKNAVKWSSIALAVAMGNGLIASQAVAQTESENQGIVEGASATLNSRTVYFNRDFRDGGKREEAATGLLLDFQSGFSQGPIGLGFDVTAMGGLKLDSGNGRRGTGILPNDSSDPDYNVPNEYSEIRGAVKANILGDTVLRYGVHFPENPVIAYDDARLLPNHYQGYSVANNSIDGLFVEAGRMNKRSDMAGSSEYDGVFTSYVDDEEVVYLGGTYTFNDQLAATLYTSDADQLWKRHFVGLSHNFAINDGLSLGTEFAFYDTSDETPDAGTSYDNQAGSLAFTLGAGNHGFTVAYQQMGGDNRFAYEDGAIFLANSVQYADFNAKDEKSYQVRYDYDFAGLGIPGLSFMTRYIRGYDIDTGFATIEAEGAFVARDTRWERNSHLNYEFQSGALEGLNVLWRNATVRQDANLDGGDIDENRLIVSYSWDLL
ncbi:OprD family outer membrane porin [Halopseudomonas nanhaiensis]|uniref:OprD family outer membrane porin n=1 Tax=Halopseudomonas nanhaiensis TaxID=2830842 RepID=UPI001CBC5711|nr:OprD family outer membrane porin [Halopseudomonas nanhaiensis]UAW97529.1 OprD family outer membrane porin [Halopseudomonas nanhaiensis]